MKYLSLLFACLISIISIKAEKIEPCGTMYNLEERIKEDPTIENELIQLEEFIKARTQNARFEKRKTGPQEVITIPVVFHVVYAINSENVPDNRLLSQLTVLNDDFRATNDDIVDVMDVFQDRIGDFEIEFCLAQQDPDGFPHSGITRTPTTNTTFSTDNNDMKFDATGGKDAWPADQYLNIWVCNLTDRTGFAQFPGQNPETDGIVLDSPYVGIGVSDGRTGSHEVGHWVGLRHIWGDGDCSADDFVEDTPLSIDSNYGCPFGINTCSNEFPDLPDMIENYMDYAYLDCVSGLFSQGQVERGRITFEQGGARFAITESTACQPSSILNVNAQLIEILNPTASISTCDDEINLSYRIRNYGLEEITEMLIKTYLNGNTLNIETWDGSLASAEYIEIDAGSVSVPSGTHELTVIIEEVNDEADQDELDNSITINFQTGGIEEEIAEGFEEVNFPPTYFQIENPDLSKTWTLNENVSFSGSQSIYVRCFNYGNQSTYDDFVLPIMDFTNYNNPILEFQSAYARYDSEDSDTLEVLISSDCGESFTSVYKKHGALLASAGNTTSEFIPTENQWKANAVDLADYAGNNGVIIKLRCINSFENNMYVDDVVVRDDMSTSIEDLTIENNFNLYPNPAKDVFSLNFESENFSPIEISITNLSGQEVYFEKFNSKKQLSIITDHFDSGVYFVNVKTDGLNKTEKLVISK